MNWLKNKKITLFIVICVLGVLALISVFVLRPIAKYKKAMELYSSGQYEEAIAVILPGRYRHFKGNEYEVVGIARHSETEEVMVVYRALYGGRGLWVRNADMWIEDITRDGKKIRRFERIE